MNWFDGILKLDSNLSLVVLSLVAAAFGILLLSIAALQESENRRKRGLRIGRSTRQLAVLKDVPRNTPNLRRQTRTSNIGIVDAIIRRLVPDVARFRARLRRTGHIIPIDQYLLGCLILAVLVGDIAKAGFGLSLAVSALIGLVVGIVVPHFLIGYMGRRRQQRILEQFPDTIDTIGRAVRSGLPVSEAVNVIAAQVRPPIGYEFQQISDSMKLGLTLSEALNAASEQIELPEFRFFIIALAIQQDTGGNLGETLDNLSKMLRRRRAMKMKVKAVTAEARASAWILGCMPFVMFGIINVINHKYAHVLVSDPRGIAMVLTGLVMTCSGIAIMVKLAKFQI